MLQETSFLLHRRFYCCGESGEADEGEEAVAVVKIASTKVKECCVRTLMLLGMMAWKQFVWKNGKGKASGGGMIYKRL